MKKLILLICLAVNSLGQSTGALDIAGDWQGTVAKYQGFRFILHIEPAAKGRWAASFYSIDQSADPVAVSFFSFESPVLKFRVPSLYGAFEGGLSQDGQSLVGRWNWTDGTSFPLNIQRATKDTAWKIELAPHKVQFIEVEKGVKLEVLDWGGQGRPLVLLAGLGRTAHVFDRFGSDLAKRYHVYGITRRGFGESSAPVPDAGNYASDRLGDDVLAVLDALKLEHPVLIGHSIAGEELSSIGTRHSDRLAGLVYLDCYAYAFYDRSRGDLLLDAIDARDTVGQLLPGGGAVDERQSIQSLLETLPRLQKDLEQRLTQLPATPAVKVQPERAPAPVLSPADAILRGEHKYTGIHGACLAIFAEPHENTITNPAERAKADSLDLEMTSAQSKAFEAGVPSCRVVRFPHANHSVYLSNKDDVLREVMGFIDGLP